MQWLLPLLLKRCGNEFLREKKVLKQCNWSSFKPFESFCFYWVCTNYSLLKWQDAGWKRLMTRNVIVISSLTNASCSFYSLQVNMFVWLPRERWHACRTFRGKIKQSSTNDGYNYWSLQHNDMGYVFSHIYLHFDKDRHLSISNILNWLLQLVVLGKNISGYLKIW